MHRQSGKAERRLGTGRTGLPGGRTLSAFALFATLAAAAASALAAEAVRAAAPGGVQASTVAFDSADGRTRLTGYLFRPAGEGPFPAVVLMHGRAGLYSTLPGSTASLDSLSVRHRYWARFWANHGHVALLVDSFSPRGHPTGPQGSRWVWPLA